MKVMCKTKYINEEVIVQKQAYDDNGRIALSLVDLEGAPMATATVNIPEVPLEDGEAFIKDYSENEGMLDFLINASIVEDTQKRVQSGFVEVAICKILI